MNNDIATRQPRGSGFLLGYMAGTLVSAAVAICLAPRSSSFRRRMTDTMKNLEEIVDRGTRRCTDSQEVRQNEG